MCARTLWPFSSSTRNMAFGSGSTTVPSTRIVSSLGFARVFPPPRHRICQSARNAHDTQLGACQGYTLASTLEKSGLPLRGPLTGGLLLGLPGGRTEDALGHRG